VTYDWEEFLNFIWGQIESHQREAFLADFSATMLIFVLVLIALVRGSRLRRRVDALQQSTRELSASEQMRFLRELRGSKAKPLDSDV